MWRAYLQHVRDAKLDASETFALIEFVKNDDPAQFLLDAAELKRWLA